LATTLQKTIVEDLSRSAMGADGLTTEQWQCLFVLTKALHSLRNGKTFGGNTKEDNDETSTHDGACGWLPFDFNFQQCKRIRSSRRQC
jgi:hypothetical protein